MNSKNTICKHCHRVCAANRARYCARCEKILRAMEKPKTTTSAGTVIDITPSSSKK